MHICQWGYVEPSCRHFSYTEHAPCSSPSHQECQEGISVQVERRLLCDYCSLLALAKVEIKDNDINRSNSSASECSYFNIAKPVIGPTSFQEYYRDMQKRLVAEARVIAGKDRARYVEQTPDPAAEEMAVFRVMIRT